MDNFNTQIPNLTNDLELVAQTYNQLAQIFPRDLELTFTDFVSSQNLGDDLREDLNHYHQYQLDIQAEVRAEFTKRSKE